MNEESIKIKDLSTILKKRLKLIIIVTALATTLAIVISFFIIKPKYETRTKMFIGKEGSIISGIDKNYNGNDVEMYQNLLKTYAEVIKTNDLVEKVIRIKNFNIKAEEVLKNLTVTATPGTQILEIKYINSDKELAKDMLDSVTDEFISEAKQLIPNSNVRVIERVRIPDKPISPNKEINIVLAFLLGLIISISLSLFMEYIKNTFNNKEQMEEILGLPVLGVIPDFLND